MSSDRSVRSLSGLGAASSNRVLNLLAIAEANAENDGHRNAPLFISNILNSSLILKHRLRADEVDFFPARRAIATKIIIPFERSDLKFGGRSLFIGQKGFEDLLQEAVNYKEKKDLRRDLDVLRLIDGKRDIDNIVDELAARYDAPREVIAGDVVAMLQDLVEKKVLRR